MRRFLPLFCLATLIASCGQAAAQSTADTVYHLHGTVVNAVTGRPVGRALVISRDRRLATMTDAEGQFTLEVSVPAALASQGQMLTSSRFDESGNASGGNGPLGGSLVLSVQRPGFLASRQSAGIPLDSSAATRNIVLRLFPSASIRGRVSATGSDSLSGVRIQLLRHAAQNGRLVWQMASSRMVNPDGTFTVTGLQPGEYTLATGEWAPPSAQSAGANAPTEQYPPEFLGDTLSLEGATRLQLQYGEAAQADLHLRAVPYYSVSIPVQGLPPNSGANVRVASGTGFQLYELGWDSHTNSVDGALPDGNYTVIVNAPGAQHATAQIPLHVAGAPVVHAPAGLVPTADIPVIVRDERTHANGAESYTSVAEGSSSPVRVPGIFLMVRPEELDAGEGGAMQVTANGPMLQNMLPGRYYAQAGALGSGYIAAMTCDGADLLRGTLTVNESGHTAPIEVTLRDDGGTVSGTVDFRDTGLTGARVLLLPADGSGHVVYAYASSSGTFQAGNVPPGNYRAFATAADQPDMLPYLDAQAMRPYENQGSVVSVGAGQTVETQAALIGLNGAEAHP